MTTATVGNKPKRWPKHAAWVGLVITLVGVLSYFMYFFQFPSLRDVPVVNLPIVFLGVLISGAGFCGVFKQGRGVMGKWLAGTGLMLSLSFGGLFNYYIFSMSFQLPKSVEATANEEAAPNFTLRDHNDQNVSLSDYRGKKVVLVFYRGYW